MTTIEPLRELSEEGAPGVLTLEHVLDSGAIEPVFQPVVDLDGMFVVGYEALARGPEGPLAGAPALFEAARTEGRLLELDWLCRERAVALARAGGLRHPLSLFVNAEPEALLATSQDRQRWGQFADLRCYAEVTERALARRPADLLKAVEQVRAQDWGIAVDDVGAEPASLALLPLLQPDVIKLDMGLLQDRTAGLLDDQASQTLHAALAQAQDTGAVLVAEGIETEQQLDLARALGADYGQGYLLGRPAALPADIAAPPSSVPLLRRVLDRSAVPGPFSVAASHASTRSLTARSVREIARQLLSRAVTLLPPPAVLVCANDPDLFDDELGGLLQTLVGLPLVGLIGSPACRARVSGLPSSALEPDDPARWDFAVAVVSPHYTAALLARVGLGRTDRFDGVLSFDRDLVVTAANAMARRLMDG